jgi:hypothetical protein
MRSSSIVRGLSATAAVLLLTACGGGSDEPEAATETPASSASAPAETTANEAPESDSEFCTQASQINQRIASSITESDGASLSGNLQTIADEISAVEPPAEIADDWNALSDALDQAASALDGVDLTDPEQAAEAQAQLSQLQSQLGDAGTNVETYLQEQCGIDTEGTDSATGESAAPSS